MKILILILLLLALPAVADTLEDAIAGTGRPLTDELKPGGTYFHYATGTVHLDSAVSTYKCKGGLDIWFNPDFDGTDVTATYTLYNCPRKTASADYATECIPLSFDPDGGGANTNIMIYDAVANAQHLWTARIRFFGATITAGAFNAQAIIRCM